MKSRIRTLAVASTAKDVAQFLGNLWHGKPGASSTDLHFESAGQALGAAALSVAGSALCTLVPVAGIVLVSAGALLLGTAIHKGIVAGRMDRELG